MSIYLGSELLGGTSHDTVSNAHSLLDYKWTDHKLNEMAWLRADTWSWQSGKVYEAAYNHLVADLSSAELKTETFNGITITYYIAKDGHKIAYESEIIKVSDIFESLGTAWWYIIDIPNKRFKLPRSTHGDIIERYQNGYSWYRLYADNWCEQGDRFYTDVSGWQNATVTLLVPYKDVTYHASITSSWDGNGDGASYYHANTNKTTTSFVANLTQLSTSYGYATWKASGYAARNVSAESPAQYLYFYVGDYSVSAIEQTAGITSEELAAKLDTDLGNSSQTTKETVIRWGMPDPTTKTTISAGLFVPQKDGIVSIGGGSNGTSKTIYYGTSTSGIVLANAYVNSTTSTVIQYPVSKGENYFLTGTGTDFWFIAFKGA